MLYEVLFLGPKRGKKKLLGTLVVNKIHKLLLFSLFDCTLFIHNIIKFIILIVDTIIKIQIERI